MDRTNRRRRPASEPGRGITRRVAVSAALARDPVGCSTHPVSIGAPGRNREDAEKAAGYRVTAEEPPPALPLATGWHRWALSFVCMAVIGTAAVVALKTTRSAKAPAATGPTPPNLPACLPPRPLWHGDPESQAEANACDLFAHWDQRGLPTPRADEPAPFLAGEVPTIRPCGDQEVRSVTPARAALTNPPALIRIRGYLGRREMKRTEQGLWVWQLELRSADRDCIRFLVNPPRAVTCLSDPRQACCLFPGIDDDVEVIATIDVQSDPILPAEEPNFLTSGRIKDLCAMRTGGPTPRRTRDQDARGVYAESPERYKLHLSPIQLPL